MAATQLFINVGASSVGSALVRSVTDLTPIPFPQLVVGDGRDYELYFVDGRGGFAAFSGDGSYIPYIAIGDCGYPSGGTAVWTFDGDSTAALAYNVSPAALQAALEALTSIGAGNVEVAGVAGKYYVITFVGALGGAAQPEITVGYDGLTPSSTVGITTITPGGTGVDAVQLANLAVNPLTFADDWTPITNGWTGSLSIRTVEVLEAFAAANGTLTKVFQVTVADADGIRSTYAKVAATILCTVIDPESFAGADKPLLATQAALNAAVLGLNNFTREALSSIATGNTNVTRPATSSRHHTARVSISGDAGIRTISLLTTNSPNPGDTILLAVIPSAVEGYDVRVYNATTGGTLLASFVTTDSGIPFLIAFSWSGSAWELNLDDSIFLAKAENLAGVADVTVAKANLRTIFSRIEDKTADFTITADDEGTLFRVSTDGGPVAATLPDATTVPAGFLLAIQKYDAATQNVSTIPSTRVLSNAGEVVVLQGDGNSWSPVLVYNPVTNQPTILQTVQNRQDLTGLTGGTSSDLNSIATAGGATSVGTAFLISAGTGGVWVLRTGTDSESVSIVRPFDFDETTNALVWELRLRGAPAVLAEGDILYFDGDDLVRLPIGTAGQMLTVNGGATAPEWGAAPEPDPVVSEEDVDLSASANVTPTASIHTARVDADGASAGTVVASVLAPAVADPSAVAGRLCKIRLFVPATAGVIIEITDDDSGVPIVTFNSTDDFGDAGGIAFVELEWDGVAWVKNFVLSPTV